MTLVNRYFLIICVVLALVPQSSAASRKILVDLSHERAKAKFEEALSLFTELQDSERASVCNEWITSCEEFLNGESPRTFNVFLVGAIIIIMVSAVVGGLVYRSRMKKPDTQKIKKKETKKRKKEVKKEEERKSLICPYCKSEIEEDWISCPHCGVKLKDDTLIY